MIGVLGVIPKADEETEELIDSYHISRGNCKIALMNVVLKGNYLEKEYIDQCNRHEDFRYRLIEKLRSTGIITDSRGRVWSEQTLLDREKKYYNENS